MKKCEGCKERAERINEAMRQLRDWARAPFKPMPKNVLTIKPPSINHDGKGTR